MIRAIKQALIYKLEQEKMSELALKQSASTSSTLLTHTAINYQNWKKYLNQEILKNYFVQSENCPISFAVTLRPVQIIYTDGTESKQVFDVYTLSRELFLQLPERFRESLQEQMETVNTSELDTIKIALNFNKTLLSSISQLQNKQGYEDVKPLTCPLTRKEIADVKVGKQHPCIQEFGEVVDRNIQNYFEFTEQDRKIIADFLDVFVGSELGNGDDVFVCSQNLLYIACKYGLKKQVEKLLELGADPNRIQDIASGVDRYLTPIYVAAKFGYTAIVNLLLNTPYYCVDPNIIPVDGLSKGNSMLYSAAAAGYADIVAELIRAGADINKNSNENISPLYVAVFKNCIPTVTRILELGKAYSLDVDFLQGEHPAQQGRTALFCAAREGHIELVHLLLACGADPMVQQGCGPDKGKTVLQVAHEMYVFEPQIYEKIITILHECISKPQVQKKLKL